MARTSPTSLLLPSELKYHIAELASPSTLARLARSHSTLQREAEETLYRTLAVNTSVEKALQCLETVTANKEKAGFVRHLTVECSRNREAENQRAIACLIKALTDMHALSDFRIRLRPAEAVEWAEGLNTVLGGGHFQLKSLYCNDDLDLPLILSKNPSLWVLGLYANSSPDSLIRTLEERRLANVTLPLGFTLQRESFYPVFDHITIFPALYSAQRNATAHLDIAGSIDEDRGSDMEADVAQVSQLSVYLGPGTSATNIKPIIANIASIFPRVTWLNLHFRELFDMPTDDLKEIIAVFPELSELNCSLWGSGTEDIEKKPATTKISDVQKLALTCTKLTSVSFGDGETVMRDTIEDDWVLFS